MLSQNTKPLCPICIQMGAKSSLEFLPDPNSKSNDNTIGDGRCTKGHISTKEELEQGARAHDKAGRFQ